MIGAHQAPPPPPHSGGLRWHAAAPQVVVEPWPLFQKAPSHVKTLRASGFTETQGHSSLSQVFMTLLVSWSARLLAARGTWMDATTSIPQQINAKNGSSTLKIGGIPCHSSIKVRSLCGLRQHVAKTPPAAPQNGLRQHAAAAGAGCSCPCRPAQQHRHGSFRFPRLSQGYCPLLKHLSLS